MREASTDASQNKNLEKEVSIEANPIKEFEPKIDTEKRADELPKIYPPKVSFSLALKVSSSSLESPSPPKLKSSSVTLENTCLESNDILSVSIASNLTPKLKTQFMSIIEEQIEEILNKQGSINGFMNYLFKIKNEDVKYFLKIGNKLLKFIIGHLSEIGNPKLLEFVNPIFNTR